MKHLDDATKQGCLALANELTKGPALFDEFGKPTDSVLRYTGSRLLGDTERCIFVGALRLLGCSDRQIAAVAQCDVRSIPLMLVEAEKTGRIPALKDRLIQFTGQNAERAQIALAELLERATGNVTMELAAMIKAVATAGGINTQNTQLLTGSATEIVQVRVSAGREEIERWARENFIDVTPVDQQSTGPARIPQQTEGNQHEDTKQDTASTAGTAGPAIEGGGVAAVASAHLPDASTRLKIISEEAP